MNITKFFAGLLPSFDRSQVIEDIEATRAKFDETVVPSAKMAEKLMHGQALKHPASLQFEQAFKNKLPLFGNRSWFQALQLMAVALSENLKYLEAQVPQQFAKDVTKATVTYRKAAALQLLEQMRFIADYATRHLSYLLECETVARVGGSLERFIQPELDYLSQNQDAFLTALKYLYVPKAQFANTLDAIPEILVVPERQGVVESTVGAHKLDPFKLGLISTRWNPIYHLRMRVAEWQVKRYQLAKEEKRMLELRQLALQEALAGKQDARLQSQLDYTAGRLQNLEYQIQQMEDKYTGG